MIRALVAIDSQRGMADASGIPWDIPTDKKFFVDQMETGIILMGHSTYLEVAQPFHAPKLNYVATSRTEPLRGGFVAVNDVKDFLSNASDDVWNIGGAGLLASTMDQLDELYITQIEGDFNCTKFMPAYEEDFELASESEPVVENGVTFTSQVWRRRRV